VRCSAEKLVRYAVRKKVVGRDAKRVLLTVAQVLKRSTRMAATPAKSTM
jgi:hypothetical protein